MSLKVSDSDSERTGSQPSMTTADVGPNIGLDSFSKQRSPLTKTTTISKTNLFDFTLCSKEAACIKEKAMGKAKLQRNNYFSPEIQTLAVL